MRYHKPICMPLVSRTTEGGYCVNGSSPGDNCGVGAGFSSGRCATGNGARTESCTAGIFPTVCASGYGADGTRWRTCSTGYQAHDTDGSTSGCLMGINAGDKGYCGTGGSAN